MFYLGFQASANLIWRAKGDDPNTRPVDMVMEKAEVQVVQMIKKKERTQAASLECIACIYGLSQLVLRWIMITS